METLEDRCLMAVLSVSNLDDAGAGSLREAIANANSGDTIQFADGLTGTIPLQSTLPTVTKSLTINGPGSGDIILDAGHGNDNIPATGDGFRHLTIDDGDNATAGVFVKISGLTLTGGDVAATDAGGEGGAILNRERLTLEYVFLDSNAAEFGGAVSNLDGRLILERSILSGNVAAVGGGAINHQPGPAPNTALRIRDSTLSYNSAAAGGALLTSAEAFLNRSTVHANHATAGSGGGIFNNQTLTMESSTLSGNTATVRGGALFSPGDFNVLFSTLAENTAATADGIYSSGGTNILSGSIVAGNVVGSFTTGAPGGNNLIDDDFGLGPLADNGGPTLTHALLDGSPAIDASGHTSERFYPSLSLVIGSVEQRGAPFSRRVGNQLDIGALEQQPTNISADFDQNGHVEANDLAHWESQFATLGGSGFLDWQRNLGRSVYDFEITTPAETLFKASHPTVTWEQSATALSYDIAISTDAAGTQVIRDYQRNPASAQQYVDEALADNDYYVNVTAQSPAIVARPSLLPAAPRLPVTLAATNNSVPFEVESTLQPGNHLIFITGGTFSVNGNAEPHPIGNHFGGLSSADYICTRSAFFAGLVPGWTGTDRIYTALLSTSTVNANERLLIEDRIVNTHGDIVALDGDDLWDGTIDNAIT